ncbi:bifunctional cytochrome P450/NADPH--P450 reductase [Ktedonospora formicarum]|uniref:Bifunctional cytochrome P450/NADPH--P450 reductase n=1 Tax=Ktedonospora formicarum TaxID=2778364 RepID=A0A8J3MS10_9CHLR|nr:cytochrome P450 [Ktedonospora formicarum]GHO42860.1 NADPH--cytochrome P450 reductase [Ktedonospora formicarum]
MLRSQLEAIPVGDVKEIHPESAVRDLIKQAQLHGPIFQIPLPDGKRRIVISSFTLTDEVCNDKLFDKRVSVNIRKLRGAIGSGLFSADTSDPNWRKAHSILMPCFSLQAMRNYMPMMIDAATQLMSKWSHLNPEDIINVPDDMSRVTLETIGLCGFSYHFHAITREHTHSFIESMMRILGSTAARAARPPIEEKLRFRQRRQQQADMDLLLSTADQLIKERKMGGTQEQQQSDLLNAMLNGVDRQTGGKLDDVNIRNQIITFLIAGHETTSGLLSFAMYFLLHHPDVLNRAYEEVDRVLGRDPGKVPTYEQIHQLGYIQQILKETLRLCPTAPLFNRCPYEDYVLGGKYQLHPDDTITILTPMLHRDRSVWGDDAEIFNPTSHFNPEVEQQRPANAFKPFGTGQRACIGREFAIQEATLILGMILQRFYPYTTGIYQLKIREALTIKPVDFYMRVRPRTDIDHIVITPLEEEGVSEETESVAVEAAQPQPAEQEAETVKMAQKTALLVLYGSNTGTSEEIAHHIAEAGTARGFNSTVGELDNYVNKLPKEGVVIIVSASYNGMPPDNATEFCQWLQSGLAKDALQGVKYTIFGCGNSEWASTYQSIPKLIDNSLEQAGAQRIYQRGEGNAATDFDGQFRAWYNGLWSTLIQQLGLDTQTLTQAPPTYKPRYEIEIVRRPHPYPFVNSFGALPMTILENRKLVNGDMGSLDGGDTRHIQISLPPNTTYRTGDHLGVLASNREEQVRRVAERFQFDRQTIIQLHATNGRKPAAPIEEPISVYDLLANYIELQDTAKRSHIERMLEHTSDKDERQHLQKLIDTGPEGEAAFKSEILDKHKSLIDLLEEYPSCMIPFNVYLDCLIPLRPRYYSISSSPLDKSDECSLSVGIVEGPAWSGHATFEGVCTSYLSKQSAGDIIYAFVQNTNSPFHLPEDTHTPIIMIAAGTGISPFRGFTQERAQQKRAGQQIGEMLLFFGCRDPQHTLYQDELEKLEQEGVVKVYNAFSRLPKQPKMYVQERVWEEQDAVWNLLQQGAIVYVCGDTNTMVPAVAENFKRIYQEKAGKSEQEAEQWLQNQTSTHRYLVDIWGINV